jgi:hypothetical protein
VKRFLPFSAVALVASVGFFAGRGAGAIKSTNEITSIAVAHERPVATPIPVPKTVEIQDSPALTEAYELLTGVVGFRTYAPFYRAVQRLTLEQVRELHRRVRAVPDNENFLETVADRWVQLDPAHCENYVRRFSTGAGISDGTGFITAWARRNPESAIEEALKSGASSKADLLLKGAFEVLAAKDPESAISRLGLIVDEMQRAKVLESCLTTWVHRNAIAATKWMQAHPETYGVGTDGNEVIAKFARNVAVRDVPTALEFSRSLSEPLRNQALMCVANEWAVEDPVAALNWCRENGLPLTRWATSSIGSVLGRAIVRAPEKTVKWIETLPEGAERTNLAGHALRSAKATFAPSLFALIPEKDQPNYVAPFMLSLNNKNVGAAREWASSLPEGKLRIAAMENLISNYHSKDPVSLIDGFAAGYSRDAAYAAYIRKSSRQSDAPDVQQLSKIADENLRQRAACDAFNTWRRTDRAAALKWMEETPHIPTEWKARLKRVETDGAEERPLPGRE